MTHEAVVGWRHRETILPPCLVSRQRVMNGKACIRNSTGDEAHDVTRAKERATGNEGILMATGTRTQSRRPCPPISDRGRTPYGAVRGTDTDIAESCNKLSLSVCTLCTF